jgi:hypothetical protein
MVAAIAAARLSAFAAGAVLTVFVLASAMSFCNSTLGVCLCACVFAAAAWRDPDLSLCLLVFNLPFDRLFHIQEQPALLLLGGEILLQVAAELWHGRFTPRHLAQRRFWRDGLKQATWPLVGLYVLLAIVWQGDDLGLVFRIKTAAFGMAALALLVCLDGRLSSRSSHAIMTGLLASAVFQLSVDLAFRTGMRGLFLAPDSWAYDPVVNGRLSGLTLNTNFIASVFLAAFSLVFADWLIAPGRRQWATLLLLATLYSGVAQTVSKGPMLASFAAQTAVFAALLHGGQRALAWRSARMAALCVGLVLVNIVVPPLLPLAQPYVAKTYADWMGSPPTAIAPAPMPSAAGLVERKLRVFVESTPIQLVDGRTLVVGKDFECRVICAGHRKELWTAGWQTVSRNWLAGIGFGGWKQELRVALGYPFSSPHNATLHLWGMFGLAGLALNLALYVVILRRMVDVRNWQGPSSRQVWMLATTIYLAISILSEAVDTSQILSLSRFGVFNWIFLAMQASWQSGADGARQPVPERFSTS